MNKTSSLILPITVFLLLTGYPLIQAYNATGTFCYPLDDTFIHMAMAKHFSQYGIWGITEYEFTSSTSSPLYTLLVAVGYYLIMPNMYLPLLLNILFSVALLITVFLIFRHNGIPDKYTIITSLCIIIFTPLPALTISGMEHTLHTLLIIILVYSVAECIERGHLFTSKRVLVLIISALLPIIRYESMFVIIGTVILLFLRKQRWFASAVLLCASLPVVTYGLISVFNGNFFFPTPVLLKSDAGNIFSFYEVLNALKNIISTLYNAPWLFAVTFCAIVLFFIRTKQSVQFWEKDKIMYTIFLISLVFHSAFARTGLFFRYEAYLMGFGVFIIFFSLFHYSLFTKINTASTVKKCTIYFIILPLFIFYPCRRFNASFKNTHKAMKNIYEQQYQMGRFLHTYYNDKVIAANDIGAISYLSNVKLIDLEGIGSIEIAKAKLNHTFNAQFMNNLTQHNDVKIAIIYDHWYPDKPEHWIKVGTWKIFHNVICATDSVSFYAIDKKEKDNLLNNLNKFIKLLPNDVEVKITH